MKKVKSQCVKVKVRLTKINYEYSAKLGLDTSKSRSFLVVHYFSKFIKKVDADYLAYQIKKYNINFCNNKKVVTTLSLPAGVYKYLISLRNSEKTSLSILVNIILDYAFILLSRSNKEYKYLLMKNEKFVSDTKKRFAFWALAVGYFNSRGM